MCPVQDSGTTLLARLTPVIDPQLLEEQAGFRHRRCTTHQVVKLTNDIKDSFEQGNKAGVVLVDLTAAHDTLWHQGLMLKLLRMIPDKHLVRFITNILANRSFVLTTSDGQHSRLRRLRNGLPRDPVFLLYFSTSTSVTYQNRSHSNTAMPMTWRFSTPTSAGVQSRKHSQPMWSM